MTYQFSRLEIESAIKSHDPGSRISVSKSGLSLSRDAYEGLGRPERVDIDYDQKHLVIRLTPNPAGRKIYGGNDRRLWPNYQILCKIGQFMPKGQYYEQEPGV